jgi:hypothetical protein
MSPARMETSPNPYASPAQLAAPEPPPAPPDAMARVANGLRYIFIGAVLHAGIHVLELMVMIFMTNPELLRTNAKFGSLVLVVSSVLDAVGGLYCWATPPQTQGSRLITIYSIAALAMVPLRAGWLLNSAAIIPSLPAAFSYLLWLSYAIVSASFLLYSLRLNGFLGQERLVRQGEIVLILVMARLAVGSFADNTEAIKDFVSSPRIFLDSFQLLSYLILKLAAVTAWVGVLVMYAHLIYATRKAVLASGAHPDSPAIPATDDASQARKE